MSHSSFGNIRNFTKERSFYRFHLTDSSLITLKKDLLPLLLHYQGKLNSILDELKNNFDQLKSKFTKLEVDLNIFRKVNSKLSDTLTNVGRK